MSRKRNCTSCGGTAVPKRDRMAGVIGKWSVRWPHGAVQPFSSEAAARKAVEAAGRGVVIPPASDPLDVDDDEPAPPSTVPSPMAPHANLRGPSAGPTPT